MVTYQQIVYLLPFLFIANTIIIAVVPEPPLLSANNVIKLIIKTYVNEILNENTSNESHLRRKLHTLGDHISTHPALHQRYLWVGKKPPMDFDPDKSSKSLVREDLSNITKHKRSDEHKGIFPSEEICKTNRNWEQINETHDLYDNKVIIIQEEELQQFVFSYRCAQLKGACHGISPFYYSECAERNGWMYMYYRLSNSKAPQWGYVSAPHHCACKIQPKFIPTVSTEEM